MAYRVCSVRIDFEINHKGATNVKKKEHTYTTMNIQGKATEIYADHPVRVCCLEHVERELDDYADNYEIAPDMFKRDEVEAETLGRDCVVCGAEGSIVLLHVKGM